MSDFKFNKQISYGDIIAMVSIAMAIAIFFIKVI